MRRPLLVLGLVLGPTLATAQSGSSLSLADAVALARENNPAYRQTLHDRAPAAWGARNAFATTFLPSASASAGIGYAGTGSERFFGTAFSQPLATWSSSYTLGLSWQLSGSTLSQPGLKRAQLAAADADVLGAESNLVAQVTQQYLSVLQARENAGLAQAQLDRDLEFLTLARARYQVGRATLIDVRQAEVARGQAEVTLLRAQTAIAVEKLRLFEILGVAPPTDLATVQLTDSFRVEAPPWKLDELLAIAEEQNPALKALRARENAARWGVRAAASSYGPSFSVSAAWSGFTQRYADLSAALAGAPPTPADSQAILDARAAYPFHFTPQPFQLQLSVSLPLFTNFARPLQVSQAKAQQNDLAESVRARGLAVRTEVSQAYLTLVTAYRAIAIQDTSRTAAREQLQLATERYRIGSGTFFELLDAQVAQLNAEHDYVSALYDYHKAIAILEAAVGRPLR